jgi:hypothetical protein
MTMFNLTAGSHLPADIADVLSTIVETTPVYDAAEAREDFGIYVVPVDPADADTLKRHWGVDFTPTFAAVPVGSGRLRWSDWEWDLYLADSETAARECADHVLAPVLTGE